MAENKTKPTPQSVAAFIEAVPDPTRREDARILSALIEQAAGEPPRMWGSSIVGFGSYRYRYLSGHGGEWAAVGFSPRAKELVVYLMADSDHKAELLARLGKHRTGKACLYIKRLADVDQDVLRELVVQSYQFVKARYPD